MFLFASQRRVVREEKDQAWAARGWVSVVLFQLWLFIEILTCMFTFAWHRRVVKEEKDQAWAARGSVSVVLFQLWLFFWHCCNLRFSLFSLVVLTSWFVFVARQKGGKGGKGSSTSIKGVGCAYGIDSTWGLHSHFLTWLFYWETEGWQGRERIKHEQQRGGLHLWHCHNLGYSSFSHSCLFAFYLETEGWQRIKRK